MKITELGRIAGGQDGTIYNGMVFRFGHNGKCYVYGIDSLDILVETFVLDRAEEIAPHCNAVVFGSERYSVEDEYPLLYANIYNNYADREDNLCGVTCVYRLWREDGHFKTKLVQTIRVGFTDDTLWRSENVKDVRPYGNFVVDTNNNRYYGFVMRDEDKTTRYFAFTLPTLADGESVVLTKDDVIEYFDTPYHNFIQGACYHDGKIYEVEGFNERIRPAIRIIDLAKKEQIFHADLYDEGLLHEPEFIDFSGDRCIYGDNQGNVFELEL